MSRETRVLESGLVDIVRDLMVAHRMTRRLFARYRHGELSFKEVKELVGDTDDSVLFRLKERSHALFRRSEGESDVAMRREALFDLAVGSLFHEAMKFRENFYQRAVYGPKVRELRSQAGPEAEELFREFEKILEASSVRLDEALQETEVLLAQAASQFRVLLAAQPPGGLVARYLIGNAELAEEVFAQDLDSLLEELHGSAAEGYRLAARSFLESGYFADARRALAEAALRAGTPEQPGGLVAYAEGMSAYLEGRYAEAVEWLERWIESAPGSDQTRFAELAHSALARVPQLVDGEGANEVARDASRLALRVLPLVSGSGAAPELRD